MRARLAILVLTVVATAAPAGAQGASFEGLGDLPGSTFRSNAYDVSADGNVVVGESNAQAFRWTEAGGMLGLGGIPGGNSLSEARGVSADGSVVVGSGNSASGGEAFRWTASGGMVGLGDLPGGDFLSEAYGVSADGSVVVGRSSATSGLSEAFRWTQAGGIVSLGDLPGGLVASWAYGVSADGAVAVGAGTNSSNNEEAFRWTAGSGMQGLGDLPGNSFYSRAYGVSADGNVVVGESIGTNGVEAFRWTAAGGMVSLGFAGTAYDASAGGTVVVGSSATGVEAFIWTAADGMRTIRDVLVAQGVDMTGWTLFEARAVSADGRVVVGLGRNPQGDTEAWRAVLSGGHRWIDPTGGSWDVASNWEPATVPGPNDAVRFDIPGTYTVFGSPAAGPRTVLGLHAKDGTVDFELDNLNLISISLTDPSLAVSSDAIAKVISGSTTIIDAIIGFEDNPAGDTTTTARLQVFNTGTTLASSSLLMIGGGTGTARGDLFVAAGELETATAVVGGASTGTAVVGNGGEWTIANLLTVGFLARGALTIEEGGRVLTDAVTLALTDDLVAPSAINVTGFGAGRRSELFVFDTLSVGAGGNGKLLVRNAGTVTTGHLAVGPGTHRGLVTVGGLDLNSGFGGELVAGTIAVGDALDVDDGGLVQANGLRIGRADRVAGVFVSGAGATGGLVSVDGPCSVEGRSPTLGPSILALELGGKAFCANATVSAGAKVLIETIISELIVRGVVNVNDGVVSMRSGTLDGIDRLGVITSDPVDVAVLPGAAITGTGTIIGAVVAGGEIGAGVEIIEPPQGEGVTPASAAGGTLEVRGRVELEPTATLEVALAGPDSTQQGRLRVRPVAGQAGLDGSAALDGTVRLAFQDGYAPHTGDTFLLLDAASTSGTFAATEVTGLEPGWQFEIAVVNGTVVLNSLSDGVPTTPAEPGAPAPAALVLHAPAPNPTAGSTAFRFEVAGAGPVRLALYDALGREVALLVEGARAAGAHEATLRAGALAPGVYLVRLTAGAGAATRRLTVVR